MDRLAVILPAAGSSTRFGRNKLLELLEGQTVVARSAGVFLKRKDVELLVIPTADETVICDALGPLANDKRVRIVPGGSCRAESVKAALAHVPLDIEWIAVHDAARPLVSDELIDRVFAGAREHNAAAPAMPMVLTVKQAHGPLPASVNRTLPRSNLWTLQTPQIMRRSDLAAAYESCATNLAIVTDDLQLLEMANKRAWLVEGEERNLKITTLLDLTIAKSWLADKP